MHLRSLGLRNWRNYAELELDFATGITVICGSNGQGKTNLVEAIGFLSTLGSHRLTQTAGLIRTGESSAVVRGKLSHAKRSVLAEIQLRREGGQLAQLNHAPVKPREILRYCHSVLVAPEDLAIVRGDPSERRRFLNEILVQLHPRLAGTFADYERVLKQRAQLLKTAKGNAQPSTLEVWNEKLIDLGCEVIAARQELVARLSEPLAKFYGLLVGANHQPQAGLALSIDLPDGREDEISVFNTQPDESRPQLRSRFSAALVNVLPKERERGVNLVGPHRDDLVLNLNQLPVKGYASHGETWSFVLALKLAAAELIRSDSSVGDPIIVLDDVFAELDQSRRDRLAQLVTEYEQVIVTSAVPDDVPSVLRGNLVTISAGAKVV